MFEICIKSRTSGYSDEDNCDKLVAKIPSSNIPQIGSVIEINTASYLVREVEYCYAGLEKNETFREFITVYVIKV